jgi:Hypothetical glycosyl hydrolase family 15
MRLRAMLPLVLLGLCHVSAHASAEPDELVPGRSVTIRTAALVKFTAKPASGTLFALPAAANRPTVDGGTLLLFDSATSGGGRMLIDLPPQVPPLGWRALGDSANPAGFQYRGAGTTSDPCTVTVKTTGIKTRCRGDAITLVPPVAGAVGIVLSLGAEPKRYCASFGGTTVDNTLGRLTRKAAPAPAACPTLPQSTTTTTTTTTTSTLGPPDADGDGVPDTLDQCPGGDDRIDLDRDGAPDACQELAVRATLDSFDTYASDAALTAVWTPWLEGGDVTITRGVGQGEDGTNTMRLTPIGPDPATGNTWASVSRVITGPTASAYDGIVLHLRYTGSTSLGLGLNLTESNGEPWSPANTPVAIRPDGEAWTTTPPGDANGVVTLPPGFHGLLRMPFSALHVPSWHTGSGDGVLETGLVANLAVGFSITGRVGDQVHIDSVSWWYGIDPAIAGRIAGRTWPSTHQAWNGIDDEGAVDPRDRIARHDLYWHAPSAFSLFWDSTTLWEPCTPDPGGSCIGLSTAFTASSLGGGAAYMVDLRTRNPNLILLAEIRYRDAWAGYLPAAHRFWQHDAQGNRILGWAEGNFYVLDWHLPEYRALVAEQARAAVEAGFDGVFIDWWDDTDDDRIDLAQAIRDAIGDRVLIVNSNDRQAPRAAPFVNGLYMEGYQSATAQHWQQLASTLAWAETAVRLPRVNAFETWFATSRADLDRMRATTTLALTHSDGYALFCDPNDVPAPDHLHSWYPFWNEPLGVPLGPGVIRADGAWQRDFTGGVAVYNPMGNATASITLAGPHRSSATGLVATSHLVPGRDGDLFLVP